LDKIMLGRRLALAGGAASTLLLALPGHAQAGLPDKSCRLILGSAPGSGDDKIARAIGPRLETRIGRHVTVENKTSATGANVGETLVKNVKDGSVLGLVSSEILAGKLTVPDFPFDPLKDITPAVLLGASQTGLAISSSTSVSTLAEYLDWVKAGGPERLRIGNSLCPTFTAAFCRLVEQKTGTKLEPVSYRGPVPMINDMNAGRIPACLAAGTSLLEHHRGGRIKIILSSARERSRLAPKVPTAAELGLPALQVQEWVGLFVAASVPAEVIEEWNRHVTAVITDNEVKAELVNLGLEVSPTSVADSVKITQDYMQDWKSRLDQIGLKPPG
jgi:tripartite-type tricarboxylate transporter receptor subunit TctC